MDVNVDRKGPCHAVISLKVPSAELERAVQQELRTVGSRTRMKGFRPGKVPAQVLEKSFGKEVRRETAQNFIRQAFEQVVKEEELRPATHPRIEEERLVVLIGSDLEIEFDLYLRPDLELQDYTGLEIRAPKVDVDDEELEKALEDVKLRSSRPEPVGEEGLARDGMALAKVELMHADEVVEERDGLRLSPETPPPGVDAQAFADALVGTGEGSVVDVPITFPEEFPKEELRGQEGTCRVTIGQAFRMVPPEPEDLLKMFGAEDEESMRENARQRILEAKTEQRDTAVETQLIQQVISMHPMELPSGLIDDQVKSRMERLTDELASQGVDPEEAAAQVEAEADSAYEASTRSLSALYLVEAIGQKEDLQITDQDVLGELQDIAKRNGATVEEVREYYSKQNLFPQLATELLEKKVRLFLRESASITEE